MQVCNTLESQQMFTSFNNTQGKADTERVIRTVKDECIWLQEWNFRFTLIRALENGIVQYNEHYLHPALVYKPFRQFEREYHLNHPTQFTAAPQIGSTTSMG
jgi:putative transposase